MKNTGHLEKKLNKLDEIPRINAGGCALVAFGLVHYIKKTHPKTKPTVVYILPNHDTEAIKGLQNGESHSCGHAVVRVGKEYIDSTGIRSLDSLNRRWGLSAEGNKYVEITPEHTMETLKTGCWNPAFQRGSYAPEINNILELEPSQHVPSDPSTHIW